MAWSIFGGLLMSLFIIDLFGNSCVQFEFRGLDLKKFA